VERWRGGEIERWSDGEGRGRGRERGEGEGEGRGGGRGRGENERERRREEGEGQNYIVGSFTDSLLDKCQHLPMAHVEVAT
jgi:hypothetical protein